MAAEIMDDETGEFIKVEDASDPTLNEMITMYIALRDKKGDVVKAHKATVAKYDTAMGEIEAYLKGWLAKQQVNAIGCAAGTAFIRRKRSATISDAAAFREFVIANNNFELADFRASVEAVATYIEEHDGQLPPGANYRVFEAVSVNRK